MRSDRQTLGETIYALVQAKLTESAEFKALIQFYGREKVKALYLEERKKRQKPHDSSAD